MIKEIAEHRSIRKFKSEAIEPAKLRKALEAAVRASTCGNMQCYSIVVSQDAEKLQALSGCHFGQVERMNAPCVVTICADMARFSEWCRQRNAEPQYDNFLWYVNGVIDGVMAAQNLILQAEAEGLGICVLGTTLYTSEQISSILELPEGVIPVTAIAMGVPDEQVALTDRLPLEGVVHYERYTPNTADVIDSIWQEREASEQTKALIVENGCDNLAQIFTQNRYKAQDNVTFSRIYIEELRKRQFMNQ